MGVTRLERLYLQILKGEKPCYFLGRYILNNGVLEFRELEFHTLANGELDRYGFSTDNQWSTPRLITTVDTGKTPHSEMDSGGERVEYRRLIPDWEHAKELYWLQAKVWEARYHAGLNPHSASGERKRNLVRNKQRRVMDFYGANSGFVADLLSPVSAPSPVGELSLHEGRW